MTELKKPKNNFYILKNCEWCNKEFESLIKRNQRFCCGKCSSISTANDKSRIDKIKKTKLDRYGSETYVNPEKAKKTCLQRYGVENASKSDKVIEKIKTTNRKKFGVECSFQSESVIKKIKVSNLKKYGKENPSQSEEVKERVKKTVREKYGCDNVFKCESIKSKIYKTNMEKYGTKIPINSDKLKYEMLRKNRLSMWEKLKSNPKINESVSIQFEKEEYISTDRSNLYKFKCNKCGVIFDDHIDGGHIPRCLVCNPYIKGTSVMESEIYDYIKSIMDEDVEIQQKCRRIIDGELDIVIPSKNVAIEFDGLYWHSEVAGKKSKTYHLEKTQKCIEKNIRLIHVFEDEWTKKENVVKSRLSHILRKNVENKVYARNCKVESITSEKCNQFLEKNHIQGKCNSSVRLGLIHNGELVSVMTFGKLRIVLGNKHKDGEYEMYRYCSSISVAGGASKLLKHFIKTHHPSKIISYSDKRWGGGDLYRIMGFTHDSDTPPNYFYIKYGKSDRLHRYGFTKHNLSKKLDKFDKNLTEWQNMQLNGYDRIWDCGHSKWVLKII